MNLNDVMNYPVTLVHGDGRVFETNLKSIAMEYVRNGWRKLGGYSSGKETTEKYTTN